MPQMTYLASLIAARAEVLRLERLIAAETCAEVGHVWCDTGEDDGGDDPLVLLRCARCDGEKKQRLSTSGALNMEH